MSNLRSELMSNPIIRIHNAETNEVIDREMTDEEYAEFSKVKQPSQEELARIAAKEALLIKLGITADEAKLLLG